MGKYYETDKAALQKKRAELGSGKYWQPKEGKNQVRILPPWSEEGVWFYKLPLHYGFKDDEDRNRAYPCLREWKGERCPACDAIAELKKVDGGQKISERLRARSKYYVNLIDRRIGEDKVFIYGLSGKMLNEILSYEDDEDYGDVVNPKTGYDFVIDRTGSGLQTRYAVRIRPKPAPTGKFGDLYALDTEVPNEITAHEMAESLKKMYDELLTDFDPDDYATKSKKKATKKEEDDEEPPKKRRRKTVEEED